MLFSSISCGPIPLLSEQNSNITQMRLFSNDSNIDEDMNGMDGSSGMNDMNGLRARTLSLFSMQQIWIAKGEMKVAFLKFLIYKLQIMIRLVSQIFGLKPHSSYRVQYDVNQDVTNSEQYHYINGDQRNHPYVQYHDYNDLQFNLLPQDFQARSRRSLQIFINWFTRLGLRIIEYF